MTTGVIVIALIIALVIYFWVRAEKRKTREQALTSITYEPRTIKTGILDDSVYEFCVAGLAHHCTKRDIGFFSGVIFNEKNNPVDRKAMAIGNNYTKKLIGYVPDSILSDYRKWSKGEKRFCVGYVFWDGEYLRGRCRAYPQMDGNSEIENDATEYASIVADHFGWELSDDGSMK